MLVHAQSCNDHPARVAGPSRFQKRTRHVFCARPHFWIRIGIGWRCAPSSTLQKVVVEVAHPRAELAVFRTQKPAPQHVRPEGVLLPVVVPVSEAEPVLVGRRRPLTPPRTTLLTWQHITHFGVDLHAVNFCFGNPWGRHNVPGYHPAFALHIHPSHAQVGTPATIPNKAPLIANHEVFLRRHVQEPISISIVFSLAKLTMTHENCIPSSTNPVVADMVELRSPPHTVKQIQIKGLCRIRISMRNVDLACEALVSRRHGPHAFRNEDAFDPRSRNEAHPLHHVQSTRTGKIVCKQLRVLACETQHVNLACARHRIRIAGVHRRVGLERFAQVATRRLAELFATQLLNVQWVEQRHAL